MNLSAILLISTLTFSGSNGSSCGSRPTGTRIVGGTQAQYGSWPWMAMLAMAGGSQFCGGSLIYEQWVLTAANCVDGLSPSDIVVRLGAYKRTDIGQELQVDQIIMHERYGSPAAFENDIALLKLKAPAALGVGVGCVCLPDAAGFDLEDKACYITGWGTLSSGGLLPSYLQEAFVPFVTVEECRESYGTGAISDSMTCAGEEGVDACQGDSGGPLVCEFNGKWYLGGAASWGAGCGQDGFPGVYTKVPSYLDWIAYTTSSN